MSERNLTFTIDDYDPDTESSFMIKSKLKGDNTVSIEIEFYGKNDNIIISFLTLFNTDPNSRELIVGIVNELIMARLIDVRHEEGIDDEKGCSLSD